MDLKAFEKLIDRYKTDDSNVICRTFNLNSDQK